MLDTLQIILLIMFVIVIALFTVLGVQAFFLVREIRRTIRKANQILDNTSALTESISEPLSAISGIAGTVSAGTLVAKILKAAVHVIAKSDKEEKK